MKRENEIQCGLKPKIELEFKRIKEKMEVQRGIEIIDKLDFPIKNENQEDFKADIQVEKDIKPKIEFKFERIKEEMEVQRGIEIMNKIDVPTIKDEVQGDFKAKIEDENDINTKLDMKIENEIQDGIKHKIKFKFERIKEEMEVQKGIEIMDKLDVLIKNEVQDDFNDEIKVEKDIKNEIKDELKPNIEFKLERIKEEMEVQRGMDIIEKVDPPTETQPRNDRTSITKKFKFCLD